MSEQMFRCYQAAESTHVVHTDGSGAAVSISRAVGNRRARALMRLCNAVLNGDWLEAQHELDQMDGDDS